MNVKVVTPPSQVITTADLRLHLRVEGTDEDSLLVSYLEAARAYAELYSGRSIGSQTLELALDAFPTTAIELPYGPVTSVSTVQYTDPTTLVLTAVDSSDYVLDAYGPQYWVVPALNVVWPSAAAVANSIRIQYVAGDLPEGVKTALLLLVGNLYENREAVSASSMPELSFGVKSLLDAHRIRLGLA